MYVTEICTSIHLCDVSERVGQIVDSHDFRLVGKRRLRLEARLRADGGDACVGDAARVHPCASTATGCPLGVRPEKKIIAVLNHTSMLMSKV
jgi:hypothetical protein